MRRLLLAGATAIVLASSFVAAPALAGGPGLFNLCEFGKDKDGNNVKFQLHCASNNFSKADNSTQKITQRQYARAKSPKDIWGLLQFQLGVNYKAKGSGGSQVIDQTQNANVRKSKFFSRDPLQTQTGINVNMDGSTTQVITQNQDLTAKGHFLSGTAQSQSALNYAGSGSNNYQEINQSQVIEFDSDYHHNNGGCSGYSIQCGGGGGG